MLFLLFFFSFPAYSQGTETIPLVDRYACEGREYPNRPGYTTGSGRFCCNHYRYGKIRINSDIRLDWNEYNPSSPNRSFRTYYLVCRFDSAGHQCPEDHVYDPESELCVELGSECPTGDVDGVTYGPYFAHSESDLRIQFDGSNLCISNCSYDVAGTRIYRTSDPSNCLISSSGGQRCIDPAGYHLDFKISGTGTYCASSNVPPLCPTCPVENLDGEDLPPPAAPPPATPPPEQKPDYVITRERITNPDQTITEKTTKTYPDGSSETTTKTYDKDGNPIKESKTSSGRGVSAYRPDGTQDGEPGTLKVPEQGSFLSAQSEIDTRLSTHQQEWKDAYDAAITKLSAVSVASLSSSSGTCNLSWSLPLPGSNSIDLDFCTMLQRFSWLGTLLLLLASVVSLMMLFR